MSTVTDTRTIKQARAELRAWGRFWQKYSPASSGGSLMAGFIQNQKSATKYHKRVTVDKEDIRAQKCRGLEIPYSADCSPTYSPPVDKTGDVFVPWSLQNIDNLIESMQDECKSALRRKYIELDDHKGVWVDRAERIVLNSL